MNRRGFLGLLGAVPLGALVARFNVRAPAPAKGPILVAPAKELGWTIDRAPADTDKVWWDNAKMAVGGTIFDGSAKFWVRCRNDKGGYDYYESRPDGDGGQKFVAPEPLVVDGILYSAPTIRSNIDSYSVTLQWSVQ